MRDKLQQFKDEIANRHLIPIENKIREIWPGQDALITLVVRTPWLADGGILITNDSLDEAAAELQRLKTGQPAA